MKSVTRYMLVHDMPVEAGTVPGTRHCPEANGTGWSGVHAPDMAPRKSGAASAEASANSSSMAPRKSGVASAEASAKSSSMAPASVAPASSMAAAASSMAAAATSGKEFTWSQDQERACERDCNSTVHGYLHTKGGAFPCELIPEGPTGNRVTP
jgi:hypothetical protein